MPNIQDAFPSNYIKASDLQGKEPVVIISHVAFEQVGRDKQTKPVIYFRGKEKGLVCNKTNAAKITALLGSSDTDDWEGRAIRLFATEVQYGTETMEGIRVKAAPSNGAAARKVAPKPEPEPEPDPAGEPTFDDEIPF